MEAMRRQPLSICLLAIACLSVQILTTAASTSQTLSRGEVWVNPGAGGGAERNLGIFFANVTLAFVGTLEDVSPQFVDESKTELYTRMTFRPTEFIKGVLPTGTSDTVDVWTPGGTYIDTPAGRRPRRPADVATDIKIGASYFVPAGRLDSLPSRAAYQSSPIRSLYLLAGTDALVRISRGGLSPSGEWTGIVIAHGKEMSPTPGTLPDDLTAFMNGLRRAAREAK